ncbi:hypothetical protein [Tropicimonas sp. IMCC34043]|uniref:hypothetical protein n=1 Tax=Tropicimonas sp. IMCC34043 TaxID=2248760 RepID=UPI0013003CBF|nr:hypothetical protein [Tropicimonas sp. IMCC34043]
MTAAAAESLLAKAAADLPAGTASAPKDPSVETPTPETYRQSRTAALAEPAPAGGGAKPAAAINHNKIRASRRAAMEGK